MIQTTHCQLGRMRNCCCWKRMKEMAGHASEGLAHLRRVLPQPAIYNASGIQKNKSLLVTTYFYYYTSFFIWYLYWVFQNDNIILINYYIRRDCIAYLKQHYNGLIFVLNSRFYWNNFAKLLKNISGVFYTLWSFLRKV